MVVDFSRTINRFTILDPFPLPLIDHIVREISRYSVFSVVDCTKSYYQVEIDPSEREYTAFQPGLNLQQFKRIPIGVTNGVAPFQRFINSFIEDNNLK